MAKYAIKYATLRAAVFKTDKVKVEAIDTEVTADPFNIEILTTKDFTEENDTDVIIVKNKVKEEAPRRQQYSPDLEPQLQQVPLEPSARKPAAPKQARRKTTSRRKTTKTKTD